MESSQGRDQVLCAIDRGYDERNLLYFRQLLSETVSPLSTMHDNQLWLKRGDPDCNHRGPAPLYAGKYQGSLCCRPEYLREIAS